MRKHCIEKLTSEEREHLDDLIHRGRHAADRRCRAQILLLDNEGEFGPALSDSEAVQNLNVTNRTVEIVRDSCVVEGLEQTVDRKKHNRNIRAVIAASVTGAQDIQDAVFHS